MPLNQRLVRLLDLAASGDPQAVADFYRLRATQSWFVERDQEAGRRAVLRMIRRTAERALANPTRTSRS